MAAWNAVSHGRWQGQQARASNSCDDQDISMSTNHSGLSIESGSAEAGDRADHHIWNQVLIEGMHQSSHGDGEKFLEVLSSKNLTSQMLDPACDYLKKLDSSWEFASNSSSLNTLEKQLRSYSNGGDMIDPERLTSNLSDLVSNWSIAPPNPHLDLMDPSSIPSYHSSSHVSHIKHEAPGSPSFPNFHSYVQEVVKDDNQQNETGAFSFCSGFGLNNSVIGLNNSGLMADTPWSISIPRNLSDLISFSSLNKPAMEYGGCNRASVRGSVSSEGSKKAAGHESSSSTKGSGRGSGTTSEVKKKRAEYSSETLFKKPKHESSSASAALKLQAPKVKVGDKITALQQIVSPFGKTDTASVLLEAINYIRFLQEQVQLLSDPYLKSNANKDLCSWGSMERKEKSDSKLDLRGRGLCLVPISCTPQAYRENNGPDYWTPTFRGCLYR